MCLLRRKDGQMPPHSRNGEDDRLPWGLRPPRGKQNQLADPDSREAWPDERDFCSFFASFSFFFACLARSFRRFSPA